MQTKNPKNNLTNRHYARVAAFVVFGMTIGALLMLHAYPYLEVRKPTILMSEEASSTPEGTVYSLSRELPLRLRVPTIGIDATFVAPLGLNTDGTISVPDSFEKVGWYKLGAAPGEKGTAAILGHVDSYQGPAVFFSLGQLAPGDSIFVSRADGTEAEFEVQYFERYTQDEFPAEKVYSPTAYPSLRLVTCSGVYDKGKKRYSHNLVVYAKLVSEETKE